MNIRKIIREEIEDDFGWVRNVNPFYPGKFFNEDDVCFDDGTCPINIDEDGIHFIIDFNEWIQWVDVYDEYRWYIEPLLYHGEGYDGNGDHYEFDSDEFNYSGYQLTDEQKTRFQQILNFTTGGEEKIDYFINEDSMLSLEQHLKYPELIYFFSDLVRDYLSELGYAVQKNRWLSLSTEMVSKIKETGTKWELYSSDRLEIDVPMDVVWNWYGKGVENLSDLLIKVSEPISDYPWSDSFYEGWDTDGADLGEYFDTFLNKAEEYLEDEDLIEEVGEKFKLLDSLKFRKKSSGWSHWGNKYRRENPNNTFWLLTIDYHLDIAHLQLFNQGDNMWSVEPKRQFKIPFEKLPQYTEQYSLKLESTK